MKLESGFKSDRRVKKGANAKLVLLDQNPLLDIEHTPKIAGVLKNGQWSAKPTLEILLAEARKVLE